jgi:hypothetical protein
MENSQEVTQSVRDLKTNQNKFWLQTQVNDILEPMMLATVHANPEDKIVFMLKYMEKQYGERASRGNKATLQDMKNEANRLEQ